MNGPTPAMARLLERLAQEDANVPDPTTLAPAEGRAAAEASNRRWNVDLPAMALAEDIVLAGLPARRVVPQEDDGEGAVLYVHGGGFAFCSKETHERAARCLAIAARAPVMTFDYRLAPEHPYPQGLDDCAAAFTAFRALMAPRRTAVAGDSAGATLALSLMLRAIEAGTPLPDCALLFYGVYDNDFASPSYIAHADGPGLTRAKMQRYLDWYVPPGDGRADPAALPLKAGDAALRALPPLYLNAAGLDPLRSDSERLAARLAALGRDDVFEPVEGVVHGFMQMTLALEEARAAFDAAGGAFRAFMAR